MKCFGNIVCENGTAKTYLNFCHFSDINEVRDRSLPTLIIGWEKAKKSIKNVSILKKWYPEQNIGWTFSKTERGCDYEQDIVAFCDKVLNDIISQNSYCQVDVMRISLDKAKKFIRFIDNPTPKLVYIDRGKFMFIYSQQYKRVYGISLTTCKYCGLSPKKITDRVFSNPTNKRVTNFSKIPYVLRSKLGDSLHLYFSVLEYFM